LHWGGLVKIVALPPVLEGSLKIAGPTLSDPILDYVQGCPDLDAEVHALHELARTGVICVESAERQINTYVLAASHPKLLKSLPPNRRRWALLPITDAPHHSLLPDLGQIIHRVLSRDPIHSAVSAVIEQCIPSMRHVCRVVQYTDSQEILLNLILALLLGTFPCTCKKPAFTIRARLWAKVHAILTSSKECQTTFLAGNEPITLLACMEYIARVVPVHMPAQDAFLTGKDAISSVFFKRVPPVCDEFRQALDVTQLHWEEIQALCTLNVEKISRLKRAHPCQPHKEIMRGNTDSLRVDPDTLPSYWDVPRLMNTPSFDDYRLLGLSLGLRGTVLMQIQRDIQITLLPVNLAAYQAERLLHASHGESRIARLRPVRYKMKLHHFREADCLFSIKLVCTT